MSEKSIADSIQSILKEHKGFMKVKDIPASMSFDMKRKLGFMNKKNVSAAAIRKAIELKTEDRFIFTKKGSVMYIVIPCDPSELLINALSPDEAVSPKVIVKDLPFSTSDFLNIVNELSESGRIKIVLNEKFEARIMLSVRSKNESGSMKSSGEYTREKFKEAFDELERGKIFVNIPELRKKLAWPHDVFDEMLRELRDEEVIHLHVTDLTIFEPEEFFYDELDNSRMGMVTWNDR